MILVCQFFQIGDHYTFELGLQDRIEWTEKGLPSIIHSDQTGFVKGRYIDQNIRRVINDILEQTKFL